MRLTKTTYLLFGIVIGLFLGIAFWTFWRDASSNNASHQAGQAKTSGKSHDTTIASKKKSSVKKSYQEATVKVDTFQGKHGWGYDVYIDGDHYVHQPHKPAVGGKEGFQTSQAALKVARLVRYKIKQGIMPPSVTPEELDSLGVN